MKKFRVAVRETYVQNYEVTAKNVEQAYQMFANRTSEQEEDFLVDGELEYVSGSSTINEVEKDDFFECK